MSKIKTFQLGGIHPDKHKLTSNQPIEFAGIPDIVFVPVKQHIGSPAKILVNPGDIVKVGTLIADADGIISANVHSPVSGKVLKIEDTPSEIGYTEQVITIKSIGDEWEQTINRNPDLVKEITSTPEEIMSIIRQSGIVGMGGAGFPTPVKLFIPDDKKIDHIILNGIECEPYLTADDRLMQEKAEQIIIGAKILNKVLGIQNAIIAIDENKPRAIEILQNITRRYIGVNIAICATKYPQGSEKQLISAITGREVPPGCLPIDVNCLVQNVSTVYAIYEAVQKHKPLIERVLTISGNNCKKAGNYLVRIGTPASYLIDKAQTYEEPERILFNGPMMGHSAINLSAPITKTTSGILLLKTAFFSTPVETACIRCGRCAEVCPQGLEPFAICDFVKRGEYQEAKKIHALDCLKCGCCAYVCPAHIPLTDYCRLAKYEIKKK